MKTSKLIEVWRDTILHYDGEPERQQQLINELLGIIRKQITPPP